MAAIHCNLKDEILKWTKEPLFEARIGLNFYCRGIIMSSFWGGRGGGGRGKFYDRNKA